MRDPATAFHEAGHAVLAQLLGIPAGRASAIDDTGYAITFHPKRGYITERIMVAAAGGIAEERFIGSCNHDSEDRQFAIELARTIGLTANHVAGIRRHTARIIDEHWSAVRAVALEILRQGWLTGRQIDQLFASKMAVMQEEGGLKF